MLDVVAAAAALYDFAAHLLLLKFARFSRLSNDGEAKAEVDALIVRSLSPSPHTPLFRPTVFPYTYVNICTSVCLSAMSVSVEASEFYFYANSKTEMNKCLSFLWLRSRFCLCFYYCYVNFYSFPII